MSEHTYSCFCVCTNVYIRFHFVLCTFLLFFHCKKTLLNNAYIFSSDKTLEKKKFCQNWTQTRTHDGDSCYICVHLAECSKVNVSLIHSTESMLKPNEWITWIFFWRSLLKWKRSNGNVKKKCKREIIDF